MYSNLRTQFKAFFLLCFYFKLTPVPAELTTVCLYAQFVSRTLTPPSIRNYLSGVKLLHLFSGADYPFTKDFVLSLTLRGIARRAFHTPRRAPPVSPSLLLRLSSFLLLNGDPRSATLLCAFLFAFFLMARLANIVPPSPMGFLLHFGAQKQFSLVNDCFIFLYLVFLAVHYVLSAHIAV